MPGANHRPSDAFGVKDQDILLVGPISSSKSTKMFTESGPNREKAQRRSSGATADPVATGADFGAGTGVESGKV